MGKMINRKNISAVAMSVVMLASGAITTFETGITNQTTYAATSTTTTKPSGTPPAKPSGNPPSGTKPSGNPPSKPNGSAPGQSNSSSSVKTSGIYSQSGKTVTKNKQTISSTASNKSAVLVTKNGKLTLTNSKITKTGKTTSEDASNFYGVNAAVVAESASKITIKDTKITINADGANAIFSTGTNSKITVSNVTINPSGDSSRGLDATMTGTIIANNLNISTKGTHCAALATDRGNGTVTLTGGTLNTAGQDSPGIYSTGTITAVNVKSTATGSEAAVLEGKNSITLKNSKISGAKKNGVMIYQSFSGDAEVGTSSFNMNGGSLSTTAGSLFYVTNTDTVINLKGVKTYVKSGTVLTASAGRWGTSGSNGGKVTLNADSQTLTGNVEVDKVSTAKINLKNSSTLKGWINKTNSAKSVALTLDSTSKWNVTGNSYLTSLTDKKTDLSNIDDNGHTIYYKASSSDNKWLGGKTYTLKDGGKLTPSK